MMVLREYSVNYVLVVSQVLQQLHFTEFQWGFFYSLVSSMGGIHEHQRFYDAIKRTPNNLIEKHNPYVSVEAVCSNTAV